MERFRNDGEREVLSVLRDLVSNGMVFVTGEGANAAYGITSERMQSQVLQARDFEATVHVVWLEVFQGVSTRAELATALGIEEEEVQRAPRQCLAVYSSRLSDSSHLIESKYDRVDEGWGERNTLATHSDLLSGICLAGNAEGAAVAAWVAYAETGSQLWAAAFVPDAGWSAGVPLGPESGSMSAAQCAVDPAGNALLAWSAHDGTKSLLYASRFEVETGFGEPQRLDQSESDDAGQRIAEAS